MSGIGRHRHDSAVHKKLHTLLEARYSLTAASDQLTVATRQVAKIEHDRPDRSGNVCTDPGMAVVNDLHLASRSFLQQQIPGLPDRRFLDIEGPYLTFFTDQSGQKQSILSGAAGGIDHPVSGLNGCFYQAVRNVHRIAQQGWNGYNKLSLLLKRASI